MTSSPEGDGYFQAYPLLVDMDERDGSIVVELIPGDVLLVRTEAGVSIYHLPAIGPC